MSLNINSVKTAQAPRKIIPAGTEMARLAEVIDLGLQPQRPWQGEEKPPAYMFRLTWEFPNQKIEVDGEDRPMWESVELKFSSHEKSNCVKWYNKLDPENLHKGDWTKLVSAPAFILIVHNPGKGQHEGKTFANIGDINPPMAGMEVPALDNPTKVFELTSPDMDTWELLPEWLQAKIKSNLQYEGSRLEGLLTDRVSPSAQAPGAEFDPDLDTDSAEPW